MGIHKNNVNELFEVRLGILFHLICQCCIFLESGYESLLLAHVAHSKTYQSSIDPSDIFVSAFSSLISIILLIGYPLLSLEKPP